MAVSIYKTLLANYGKGKNYAVGRSQKVKYVVEHHTATMATAWDNLKYFASKWVGASAHYFIERDGRIYQSVLEKDTAFSVGAKSYRHPKARNSNSISIEYISDGRAFTEEQIKAGAALTQDIIKRYGLSNSAILRHFDVTGKKCPGHYVNETRWGKLLARLKLIVAKPVPVAPKPAPAKPAPKAVAKPKPVYKGDSIVEYLNSIKKASSFKARAQLAKRYGIKGYKGTAAQNSKLLKKMRGF